MRQPYFWSHSNVSQVRPFMQIIASFSYGIDLHKKTKISIFINHPIAVFFLILTVGENCFDNLPVSFQVCHTSSLQMGSHREALKFNISGPCTHIHTIKTMDRNTCRYLSNQNVDAYRLHTTAALATASTAKWTDPVCPQGLQWWRRNLTYDAYSFVYAFTFSSPMVVQKVTV